MKKQIYLAAAVLFTAGMMFIAGCKKDDTTPPAVSLLGSSSITASLQGSLSDPGASADDDEDGDISSSVTSDWSSTNPNLNLKGTYTITYSVSDAAGNTGTATRTVVVVNDADSRTGTYNCTIVSPAWAYTQTITASTTKNNRILFSKFGDYDNNTGIYADVTGSTVDLPSQTAVNVGTPATTRTFAGTGTTNTSGFSLSYTETTSTGSANFVENFVKQ
ncbi:MAG: DUF5011 domain-containing protein [Candidatus Woesearchaeota archaeon]|nr:DUF5011 domain-containing protein [Candidatus Woesearchaeota archaeon]